MKILLATDGSPEAHEAVLEIARLSWPRGSTVRVLTVAQVFPPPATEVGLGATIADFRAESNAVARQVVNAAAELLQSPGVAVETAVREGDPRAVIIDEANEWGAELIVVGSYGKTALKRWLLGSVAQAIVAHASCSVLVVRRREIR